MCSQRTVSWRRHVGTGGLRRFIYASTSSVYGRTSSGDETIPTRPISPYGVTKLAAEHLCRAYAEEHGLPLVVLRYFSVYGPRQRPDMGYHRFIHALLSDEPVTVYGDGMQVRGNTYVDDCVEATIAAVDSAVGEIYNVGGGETATVWQILQKLEALVGRRASIRHEPARPGDQRSTVGGYEQASSGPRLAPPRSARRRPGTASGVAERALVGQPFQAARKPDLRHTRSDATNFPRERMGAWGSCPIETA